MLSEGKAGPRILQDGAQAELYLLKNAAGAVGDAAAHYQETIYRGNAYVLNTGTAGVALAAANASLVNTTFQPIVGFLNPSNSGVIAVILHGIYGPQATGASAVNEGIPIYQVCGPNAASTIAQANQTNPTNLKTLLASGSLMIGSVNQAFAGISPAWTVLKPFVGSGPRFSAPTASINVNGVAVENVDGLIQIPPGWAIGLGVLAAGTTITVTGGLVWKEIPV